MITGVLLCCPDHWREHMTFHISILVVVGFVVGRLVETKAALQNDCNIRNPGGHGQGYG